MYCKLLPPQIAQTFPHLGLLVMFGLYISGHKHRLDASTAFTALVLVRNIRRNVSMASANSRKFTAAIVAFERLDNFFRNAVPLVRHRHGQLRLENASFRRNSTTNFELKNLSVDFVQGGLNIITGSSGSGKSTLLLGILGETHLESGRVTTPSDIAFASQSPWLQPATIEENILFRSDMEKSCYLRVIEACCLAEDFEGLPDGDRSKVGENEASLSGGKKARVALARAIYSKAPLLLLDDIFAALDSQTSATIWRQCFCSNLLAGRTVVLVTQVPGSFHKQTSLSCWKAARSRVLTPALVPPDTKSQLPKFLSAKPLERKRTPHVRSIPEARRASPVAPQYLRWRRMRKTL